MFAGNWDRRFWRSTHRGGIHLEIQTGSVAARTPTAGLTTGAGVDRDEFPHQLFRGLRRMCFCVKAV